MECLRCATRRLRRESFDDHAETCAAAFPDMLGMAADMSFFVWGGRGEEDNYRGTSWLLGTVRFLRLWAPTSRGVTWLITEVIVWQSWRVIQIDRRFRFGSDCIILQYQSVIEDFGSIILLVYQISTTSLKRPLCRPRTNVYSFVTTPKTTPSHKVPNLLRTSP